MSRRFLRHLLCLFSFGLGYSLSAQVDTILALPEVKVVAVSLRNDAIGTQQKKWSVNKLKKYQSNKLPFLLERESGVFVKSYGLGSSATTSIRGGSASQTAVFWNGLPLQSPMLGQLDFSLMPLGIIEEASLQYGGASDSWGSGAVGGLIHLGNRPIQRKGLSAGWNGEIGAFGQHTHLLNFKYKGKQLAGSSRIFYHAADNDFEYRAAAGQDTKKLEHARVIQQGALQELYWITPENGQFSWRIWLQETDRELPPTTVQNRSLATQYDAFLRTMLSWEQTRGQIYWQAKAAVFHEVLDYKDELILLETNSRFTTLMGEIEADWYINESQRWHFAITDNLVEAETNNYDTPIRQNRFALQSHFRQEWRNWRVQLGLRLALIDDRYVPVIPGLGAEYLLGEKWTLNARVNRTYRWPTLNDLYWSPGGNAELKPEQGWSQEAGVSTIQPIENLKFKYQLTFFNRNIENWILWSPSDAGAFWSAQNLTEVWSRGIEQRLAIDLEKKDWQINFKAGHDLVHSTNEVALSNPKLGEGEQLAYVPIHRFFGGTTFSWKKWELDYLHRFTGKVSAINVDEMPAYHVGDLRLQYGMTLASWQSVFYLRVNNIWDTEYRIVERRPMPGRYYQLGINLTFTSIK